MVIIYKKNLMIVTHPSGVVSRYSFDDLKSLKREADQGFEDANNAVLDINKHILNVELQE